MSGMIGVVPHPGRPHGRVTQRNIEFLALFPILGIPNDPCRIPHSGD